MKNNEDIKQLTILVLQGPPASGKTTWAKEFVKEKRNWIRVNRDDIRLMTGDYWIPSRENLITKYETYMITTALENKYNVIIDATNLSPKTISKWEGIAQKFNAELKVKEFIVPFKEAVKRDKKRDLQVGEDTIRSFYRRYYPDILKSELNEL